MDSKNWNKKCRIDLPEGLAPGNAAEVVPVDMKDGVDKEIVDIFVSSGRPETDGTLVSSPDGLVRIEEDEEIMFVRGKHVETPKEHVKMML